MTIASATIERVNYMAIGTNLTHEEIKAVLARKYGTAQAACKDIRDKAWVELTEHDDVEAYKFNCEQAMAMLHYSSGILAAAEALGIDKDELIEAAEAIRAERGLQDES